MKRNIVIGFVAVILLGITSKLLIVAFQQQKEFSYHITIPQTILLESNDFESNGMMPSVLSGKGGNKSPELHWRNLPQGTQSLVVLMTDYDGPAPFFKWTIVNHWVVYNIQPTAKLLPQGIDSEQLVKDNITSGINYTGKTGYDGPNPPIGVHRYYFRIYALSVPSLEIKNVKKQDILSTIEGKVLAYGELIGRY